jgi:DNA mismatch repair protein MutS
LPGAQNYKITAVERDGTVVFLHKLERGKASQSYGIAVAQLAGLPPQVLARAREVLEKLEKCEIEVFADVESNHQSNDNQTQENFDETSSTALSIAAKRAARNRIAAQTTLFQTANESLIEELRLMKIENFSFDELQRILREMQKRIV